MDNKVEKFIQAMEAKIEDNKLELSNLSKDDYITRGVKSGFLIGLEHSLNLFKILNDR